MTAGIVATTADARELLGWWSILLSLLVALLLHVALTKGLQARRHQWQVSHLEFLA